MRILGVVAAIALVGALAWGALGTGAWFTDTAALEGNVVTTGNMDLSAGSANADSIVNQPMGFDNLEPGAGYVTVGYFWTRNDGDYDMKWRGYLNLSGNTGLTEYIQVRCVLNPTSGPWDSLVNFGPPDSEVFTNVPLSALQVAGNSHILMKDPDWPFTPGAFAFYELQAKLLSTAPNAMQEKTLTADLVLDATQYINTGWTE